MSLPSMKMKPSSSKKSSKSISAKDVQLPPLVKTAPEGVSRKRSAPCVYRYNLYRGNNIRVVLNSLRCRPWWHGVSKTDGKVEEGCIPNFIWEMYRNPKRYVDATYQNVVLNHLQNNFGLVAKKGLYFSLKSYCGENGIDLLQIIPRTYYLSNVAESSETSDFLSYNNSSASSAENSEEIVWIMKPASKTNRGFGIKVVRGIDAVLNVVQGGGGGGDSRCSTGDGKDTSEMIKSLNKDARKKGSRDGWIVQEYMTRPLLVDGRKFDIRCFVLLTLTPREGLRAYFFKDAYVRTSSKKYTLKDISDKETHLTNDAVQKYSKAYGKFENGNKLNFEEWQQAINRDYPGSPGDIVQAQIFPEIKRLSRLSVEANRAQLEKSEFNRCFELLGYDYMVDELFAPKLIEINSNPCLEFACPLLVEIISSLIENVARVALDNTFFPPPSKSSGRSKACEEAILSIESQEMKFDRLL